MNRRDTALLIVLLLLVAAPVLAGRDDAEVMAELERRASKFVVSMLGGNGHMVQSDLVPHLRPTLNPESARIFFGDLLTKGGGLREVGAPTMKRTERGEVVAMVPIHLRHTSLAGRIVFQQFTPHAKISAFSVDEWDDAAEAATRSAGADTSPVGMPGYAIPETIRRIAVEVPAGELLLRGELVLPAMAGESVPVPGAVLFQGLGTYDEDMTIGRAKPFRDIAVGMASRGVAVLRMETPDRAAPEFFAEGGWYDLEDYRLEPARLAVEWLAERPEIDASAITVVGHGLGAYLAPVVAERAQAARVIVLSPWSVPVSAWIESRAADWLESPTVPDEETRATWQRTLDQSVALREGGLDPADSIFGISAPVWNDLERLDPAGLLGKSGFRTRVYYPAADRARIGGHADPWIGAAAANSYFSRVDFVENVSSVYTDVDSESPAADDILSASNVSAALVREMAEFARTGKLPIL